MKRIGILLIAITMFCGLCGCKGRNTDAETETAPTEHKEVIEVKLFDETDLSGSIKGAFEKSDQYVVTTYNVNGEAYKKSAVFSVDNDSIQIEIPEGTILIKSDDPGFALVLKVQKEKWDVLIPQAYYNELLLNIAGLKDGDDYFSLKETIEGVTGEPLTTKTKIDALEKEIQVKVIETLLDTGIDYVKEQLPLIDPNLYFEGDFLYITDKCLPEEKTDLFTFTNYLDYEFSRENHDFSIEDQETVNIDGKEYTIVSVTFKNAKEEEVTGDFYITGGVVDRVLLPVNTTQYKEVKFTKFTPISFKEGEMEAHESEEFLSTIKTFDAIREASEGWEEIPTDDFAKRMVK